MMITTTIFFLIDCENTLDRWQIHEFHGRSGQDLQKRRCMGVLQRFLAKYAKYFLVHWN